MKPPRWRSPPFDGSWRSVNDGVAFLGKNELDVVGFQQIRIRTTTEAYGIKEGPGSR